MEVPVLGGRVDVDGRHDDRHGQGQSHEREADCGAALAAAAPATRAAGAAAAALTHRVAPKTILEMNPLYGETLGKVDHFEPSIPERDFGR